MNENSFVLKHDPGFLGSLEYSYTNVGHHRYIFRMDSTLSGIRLGHDPLHPGGVSNFDHSSRFGSMARGKLLVFDCANDVEPFIYDEVDNPDYLTNSYSPVYWTVDRVGSENYPPTDVQNECDISSFSRMVFEVEVFNDTSDPPFVQLKLVLDGGIEADDEFIQRFNNIARLETNTKRRIVAFKAQNNLRDINLYNRYKQRVSAWLGFSVSENCDPVYTCTQCPDGNICEQCGFTISSTVNFDQGRRLQEELNDTPCSNNTDAVISLERCENVPQVENCTSIPYSSLHCVNGDNKCINSNIEDNGSLDSESVYEV